MVFIVPPDSIAEELLYDFNMQVGDIVYGYIASNDIVQSIDSVLIGGSYRKRWLINPYYNIYLIEGVGSTYGLLAKSPGSGTDALEYNICFQENGQTLFPSTTTSCELITSTNSIEDISEQVNIFPNPSRGLFNVNMSNSTIGEIQITDLLGNVILRQTLNRQASAEIKELKSGTYILTITDSENKKINRKIIIL
jgi:hypothetical protein